jgi:hypothetical protein
MSALSRPRFVTGATATTPDLERARILVRQSGYDGRPAPLFWNVSVG